MLNDLDLLKVVQKLVMAVNVVDSGVAPSAILNDSSKRSHIFYLAVPNLGNVGVNKTEIDTVITA